MCLTSGFTYDFLAANGELTTGDATGRDDNFLSTGLETYLVVFLFFAGCFGLGAGLARGLGAFFLIASDDDLTSIVSLAIFAALLGFRYS